MAECQRLAGVYRLLPQKSLKNIEAFSTAKMPDAGIQNIVE